MLSYRNAHYSAPFHYLEPCSEKQILNIMNPVVMLFRGSTMKVFSLRFLNSIVETRTSTSARRQLQPCLTSGGSTPSTGRPVDKRHNGRSLRRSRVRF